MNRTRYTLAALLALAALTFAGCACPMSGQTCPARHAAAPARKGAPSDRYSGAWAGTWQSAVTKHHGKLLCDFAKMDPRHYRAEFHAYWGFLNGRYSVLFDTHRVGQELHFAGRQDLGKLYGGVYRYQGKVTGDHFTAKYESADDHGTFTLQRTAATN